MTTWFAQNSSVNINSVNQWNSAANGSGSWLTWADLGASDVLVLNGKTGIVINVDFVCGSLTAVANGGTAGGGCTVASTRSITANVICSSVGTPVITLSSGTLTVIGNVTGGGTNVSHGIHMFGTSVLSVTGNVTGGTMSSGGGNSNGIRCEGTGNLTVIGNVTGTTGTAAIAIAAVNTVTITGTVTGGSNSVSAATGITCTAASTIVITGNVVGDGSDGIFLSSSGTITVNGNLTAGSVGSAVYSTSISSKLIINGDLTSSSTGVSPINRLCVLIAPSTATAHTYRVNNSGSAGIARSLYTGGVNLGQPVAANVRSGTTYGASSEYTGTLVVPSPTLVAIGVQTDNTVGSYAPNSGLNEAGVRSAIGMASANLDTQLEALSDRLFDITGEQLAAITVESGTIGNFPEVLTIGDSYDTDTGWIKVAITNESGDPIDSLGSLLFEDATVSFTAFRPNDSATISGSCEFVDSGSETYVKLTFTSVETNKGLPEYTYEGRLKFVWTGGKQKTYKTTPFKFIANP